MDPLDQLALREGLSRFGGERVVRARDYFGDPHPIDDLIALAQRSLPQPLLVGVSELGKSAHFFLPGLPFLPVIVSARYLGIVGKLLSLRGESYNLDGLRRQAAEMLALELIAEFCLVDGTLDWPAALFFMKSRLVGGNLLIADPRSTGGARADILAIPGSGADEHYVCELMFGLAHELGHAIDQTRGDGARGPPWCSDDELVAYRDFVAGTFGDSDAGLSYRLTGASDVLEPDRLRCEAAADIEGCRLIARAVGPILAKYGNGRATVDVASLLDAISMNYLALAFIENCRRTATSLNSATWTGKRLTELCQQPIAFATRECILKDHLPIIVLEALHPDRDVPADLFGAEGERHVRRIDPELRGMCLTAWDRATQGNKGFYDETEAGILAAIKVSENDDAQMQQLVADYSKVAAKSSFAVENFVCLAAELGVPDSRWKALADAIM